MGKIDQVGEEIADLRKRKQTLEFEVSESQSVIGFNEEMLEDAHSDLFDALTTDETDVTNQLLSENDVICWTCGSEVDREQVESTLSQLRELSQEKVVEMTDLDDEIDELVEERQHLERGQRERDQVERRLRDIETEIEESEATIAQFRERRTEVTEEIEQLERKIEEQESQSYDKILDLHKEANQLEYEIGRLQSDLEQTNGEIASIEARIDGREEVESQLQDVMDEIMELRTWVDSIEERAVQEFNEHMDEVLELLNYTNLDRIWIERVEQEEREGRRTIEKTVFELHVIRKTESGTAYEDTVDHLSESEREVTGLIFALAGYLAHEVYEDVPFMLLDSLEALDY